MLDRGAQDWRGEMIKEKVGALSLHVCERFQIITIYKWQMKSGNTETSRATS
jgi:hypothetical protein